MAPAEDRLLGKQRFSSLRCLLQLLFVAVQERPLLFRLAFSSLMLFLHGFRMQGKFSNI